jgi:hypothetical protein
VSCLLLIFRLLHAACGSSCTAIDSAYRGPLLDKRAVRLDRRSEWQSQELDDFIGRRRWRFEIQISKHHHL